MIVSMKKTAVVVQEQKKREALLYLREIGTLHLNTLDISSEELSEANLELENVRLAFSAVEDLVDPKAEAQVSDNPKEVVGNILQNLVEKKALHEKLDRNIREKEKLLPWGEFPSTELAVLKDKGVFIKLCELTAEEAQKVPADVWCFKVNPIKGASQYAVISKTADLLVDFEEVQLPESPLSELEKSISDIRMSLGSLEEDLVSLASFRDQLHDYEKETLQKLEFETAVNSMEIEGYISYLTGYIPINAVDDFKREAGEKGWAYIITDPAEDDNVPILVKRPGPVKIIKPVFDLMGTFPGYHEQDISTMFLLAFILFVAMIIGDAGYGLIFLAIGILGLIKSKNKLPFSLTVVLSMGTVIWGAITGTWFGSRMLATSYPFKMFVIPQIASFPESGVNPVATVQLICFIIGLLHLSQARIEMFIRTLPRLKAFEHLGWLVLLWGLFILVLDIVLGTDTLFGFYLSPYTVPLIITGFAFIILFANQNGNFFKGILHGLNPINLLLNFLDGVGAFSNIISYVRLFAVGLASVAVASSFNSMAAGIGFSGAAAIGAGLVLFLGHGLNIIMGVMSIVVHGIRLNMLEYSGQVGLEWSGIEYSPFRKQA